MTCMGTSNVVASQHDPKSILVECACTIVDRKWWIGVLVTGAAMLLSVFITFYISYTNEFGAGFGQDLTHPNPHP